MDIEGFRKNLPLFAAILIFIFYGISLAGVIYDPLGPQIAKLVNKDGAFSGLKRETFIEWIEAIFWLIAFAFYLALFILRIRKKKWDSQCCWLLILAILCFVALGEETSWGQHIFGFDSPDYLKQVNKQRETNVHNLKFWLKLPEVLGLNKYSMAHSPLFVKLVEYLPQFVCTLVFGTIWIILPISKRTKKLSQRKAIRAFPDYSRGIPIFFAINIVAYVITDALLFDVGEVYELAISSTALISALDLFLLRATAKATSNRP